MLAFSRSSCRWYEPQSSREYNESNMVHIQIRQLVRLPFCCKQCYIELPREVHEFLRGDYPEEDKKKMLTLSWREGLYNRISMNASIRSL